MSYPLAFRSPELWRAVCDALGDAARDGRRLVRVLLVAEVAEGSEWSEKTVSNAVTDLCAVGLVRSHGTTHGTTHGRTLATETASRHHQTTPPDGNTGPPKVDLNPSFVAALMGVPPDWLTPYTSEETASSHNAPAKRSSSSPHDSETDTAA